MDREFLPIPASLKISVHRLDVGFLVTAEFSTNPGYTPRVHRLALPDLGAVEKAVNSIAFDFAKETTERLSKAPDEL